MNETEVIVEPGQPDIVIRRTFDVPPEVFFRAVTDPDLIPKWWGPREINTHVEEMDPRRGGTWRFVHRAPDGTTVGFQGVYHEVTAPHRIVQTFEYDGAAGHVTLETLTLEEVDGKTRYVVQALHQSVESRDAAVRAGMDSGLRQTLDRLADTLRELSAAGQ